jgi:pimeloyl-ACP methyl ester carboxylesterase
MFCYGVAMLATLLCACVAQSPAESVAVAATEETAKSVLRIATPHGEVGISLHLPNTTVKADTPVFWIVHGFLRRKNNMDGWAAIVAENGYIGISIDTPTTADHPRNGAALAELAELADQGEIPGIPAGTHPRAFAGYSAGGLSSLIAASRRPERTALWIGLDPVDRGGLGAEAIAKLHCPIVIMRAEPSAWNANGNAQALWRSANPPALHLIVEKASHADLENPYDPLAGMVCGRSTVAQRETFIALFKKLLAASGLRGN